MQVNQDDRIAPKDTASGANKAAIITLILVTISSVAGYFYYSNSHTEIPQESTITEAVISSTIPEVPVEPLVVQETLPESAESITEDSELQSPAQQPEVKPLPALNESDQFTRQKTLAMDTTKKIEPLLIEKNLIRQFVVFVDNVAQGEFVRKMSPLTAPNRQFTVTDITNKTYLNPDSYHRYDQYAEFMVNLDDEQLIATYQQLQPLLTEAFNELGYDDITFNERLSSAIDDILAAPVIEYPIELDSISVNYQFVDPELEALSGAQKLMIRMGPENSKKIQAVLAKFKRQL